MWMGPSSLLSVSGAAISSSVWSQSWLDENLILTTCFLQRYPKKKSQGIKCSKKVHFWRWCFFGWFFFGWDFSSQENERLVSRGAITTIYYYCLHTQVAIYALREKRLIWKKNHIRIQFESSSNRYSNLHFEIIRTQCCQTRDNANIYFFSGQTIVKSLKCFSYHLYNSIWHLIQYYRLDPTTRMSSWISLVFWPSPLS